MSSHATIWRRLVYRSLVNEEQCVMFIVAVAKYSRRSNLEKGCFILAHSSQDLVLHVVFRSGSTEGRMEVLRSSFGFDSIEVAQANGMAPPTFRVGLPISSQSRDRHRQGPEVCPLGDSHKNLSSWQPSQMVCHGQFLFDLGRGKK